MSPLHLLGVETLSILGIILTVCIVESTTDENLSLQRYSPDDQLATNKRIMQSAIPSDVVGWPKTAKLKQKPMDVKSEIAKLNISYVYQSSWPDTDIELGAVTAVSFDKAGNVVIFHRVDRIWDQKTFDNRNVFQQRKKGPIPKSTVLAFDRNTGRVVYDWGKMLFYMPHGLTIDHEDNVWVTDVALHQVFKFGPHGSGDKPLMTLGTAFVPGAGEKKFCKPTAVAVLANGDFFVADGYCNARIVKFSKNGENILYWGQNSFSGVSYEVAPHNYFAIPHALTLVRDKELLCAADRENGRIQCFYWANGTFHSQYHSRIIGDRLFSMDYTPANGGQFVVVNGPTSEFGAKPEHYNEVRGYIVDMKTNEVLSKFGPNGLQFENPHDVAVTEDGNEIYVAELSPMRIHKFQYKSLVKSRPMSAPKPTATSGLGPEYESISANAQNVSDVLTSESDAVVKPHRRPGGTAILVASLMLLFAFLTFAMALLIARRRKRGCLPFGTNNRRHAWDFPSKSEGFKLGGLLMDRSKHNGFEKLDQNASDEENETGSSNMLASAQFA